MSNTIYNKADSILEIRGIDYISGQMHDRIKAISNKSTDEEFKKIYKELSANTGNDGFFLRSHVIEELSRLSDNEISRYLKYRYAYEVYPQEKIVTLYPPLVQIEPTSICNYRCVFCYQTDERLTNKKNGHIGQMSLELFKDIVDQLEGNVEAITLASRGEPTVNRHLDKMLQYLSGKFLAVKVNTNAFKLDEKLSHAILESDIQTLVFSADAADAQLYSELRVNGNLDKVLKNIRRFISIKEKCYSNSRLITRVSGVRYDKRQSIESMESLWGDLVEQVMFVDYNPWENVYDSNKKGINIPCTDLWRRMFIWWDGKVGACDVDYLTTLMSASVKDNSISEIWQGELYHSLRKSHLENNRENIEPCTRCVTI